MGDREVMASPRYHLDVGGGESAGRWWITDGVAVAPRKANGYAGPIELCGKSPQSVSMTSPAID